MRKLLIYTVLILSFWSCKPKVYEPSKEDVYHITYGEIGKVVSVTSYNKHLNTNDQYIDEEIDYFIDDSILTVEYASSMSITPSFERFQFIIDSNHLIQEDINEYNNFRVHYQDGKCIRITELMDNDSLDPFWEIEWNNNNVTELTLFWYNSNLNMFSDMQPIQLEYYDTNNLSPHFFPYPISEVLPFNKCISPEYLGLTSKSLPSEIKGDTYTRKFEYELYDNGKIKKVTIDENYIENDYWDRKYVSFKYE